MLGVADELLDRFRSEEISNPFTLRVDRTAVEPTVIRAG